MGLPDDFLDLPLRQFVDRLVIGAEGEDDLAGQFQAVGWPICQFGRAAEGAEHSPLLVGKRKIKLPDMMVNIPALGCAYVEARVKRKGTIPGTDCYGMNTRKNGATIDGTNFSWLSNMQGMPSSLYLIRDTGGRSPPWQSLRLLVSVKPGEAHIGSFCAII